MEEIERLNKLLEIEKLNKLLKELIAKLEPKGFVDLVREAGTPLDESSLLRIWQYVTEKERKSFAVLSAHKSYLSPKENEKRFRELQRDVRSAGYGYVKIRGYYVEQETKDAIKEYKTKMNELEKRKQELRSQKRFANAEEIELQIAEIEKEIEQLESRSYEDALFVPLMDFETFQRLLRKYNLESGIYMNLNAPEDSPDRKKFGQYSAHSPKAVKEFGKMRIPSAEEILSAWSEIKKRKFVFEAISYAPGGLSKWEKMMFVIS